MLVAAVEAAAVVVKKDVTVQANRMVSQEAVAVLGDGEEAVAVRADGVDAKEAVAIQADGVVEK